MMMVMMMMLACWATLSASFFSPASNFQSAYHYDSIENDDQNFVLSGGINSQNVDNALKTNSWCLDLNFGVESQEGIKNIELVKDILKTIETYGI